MYKNKQNEEAEECGTEETKGEEDEEEDEKDAENEKELKGFDKHKEEEEKEEEDEEEETETEEEEEEEEKEEEEEVKEDNKFKPETSKDSVASTPQAEAQVLLKPQRVEPIRRSPPPPPADPNANGNPTVVDEALQGVLWNNCELREVNLNNIDDISQVQIS